VGVHRPQQRARAELRQQVAADGVAVVAHGRRAERLLVLDVVKPRVAGLGERAVLVALVARVGRFAWRLGQQLMELVVCLSGGEVARVGLRAIGRPPHNGAPRCTPAGVLDMG